MVEKFFHSGDGQFLQVFLFRSATEQPSSTTAGAAAAPKSGRGAAASAKYPDVDMRKDDAPAVRIGASGGFGLGVGQEKGEKERLLMEKSLFGQEIRMRPKDVIEDEPDGWYQDFSEDDAQFDEEDESWPKKNKKTMKMGKGRKRSGWWCVDMSSSFFWREVVVPFSSRR